MPVERTQPIRYVVLSDLHFGEEDSLLTHLASGRYECDCGRASPVLESLVLCLRHLVSTNPDGIKPTLVLAGDILELAFATYSQSLAVFERFLELIAEPGDELFDRIILLPGNHDHHLWEVARETQFVNNVLAVTRAVDLPPPIHTTPATMAGGVPSFLLNQLVRHVRDLAPTDTCDYPIIIVYPNLALFDESGERGVVIHHGHFVEALFMFMTTLRRRLFPNDPQPATVAELEADNFAWIDFVWSLLGRSGSAGARAENLYKKLQYPSNLEGFVTELARQVAKNTDIPFIPGDWLEERVLRGFFRYIAKKLAGERSRFDGEPNEKLAKGLHDYIFRFVRQQLRDEFGGVPKDLTFIYGHTHKPAEERLEHDGQSVAVYNTGGWIIDATTKEPNHGGSIALIAEDMSTVTLRVYEDVREGNDLVLAHAPSIDERTLAFHRDIERRVGDPDAEGGEWRCHPLWARCVELIGSEAAHRRKILEEVFVTGRGERKDP